MILIENKYNKNANRKGQIPTTSDISNLYVGLVVENYRQMCEILSEDVKTGNAKKAQIKDWGCYFSYEKNKHKFVITEVYDVPRPKEDKRAEQSIYIKLIELMLMYELSQKRDNTCAYTKIFMFNLLGMVNQNYLPYNRNNALQKIKDYNIQHWQIEHFNSRCNDRLTKILFQALNSMKRRKLLDWDEQIVVTEIINDDRGIEYISRVLRTREEKDFVRFIEKEVLNELGHSVVPFRINDREKYYDALNERFKDLRGWIKVYKEYELHYYCPHLIWDIPKVKSEIKNITDNHKLELNELVLNSINQQARNKYYNNLDNVEKAKDEAIRNYDDNWFGEKTSIEMIVERAKSKAKENGEKNPFFEMPEDYIENQLVLANVFINISEKEKVENEVIVDWT